MINFIIMESFCLLIRIIIAAFCRSLEVVRIRKFGEEKSKIIVFGHVLFHHNYVILHVICTMLQLRYLRNEPAHEIMALFVLRKLILQTRMPSYPVGPGLIFDRTLRLLPYFMCANSEGSGETARMHRLA